MEEKEIEECVEGHLENFKVEMYKCLNISKSPEDVKWAIFSTGSRELEEAVMDKLVSSFLKHVEGVYVFRPSSRESLLRNLEEAVATLKEEQHKETMAGLEGPDQEYKVTLGN